MGRTGGNPSFMDKKLGVIGGSGLYDMAGVGPLEPVSVQTPFGSPSDAFLRGTVGETELYFLPRHGRGHRLLPSEINHRANIYGFKLLGVRSILSLSAVGSLREDVKPRDILIPDQYFDRTRRTATFFGDGLAAHVPFGDPICPALRGLLCETTARVLADSGASLHDGGTYVNMEGPAFSTRAESQFYRRMGWDVIGMTSLPEAKLCREAQICYAVAALVTDYDCWHEGEDVHVEMVVEHMRANTRVARQIVQEAAHGLPVERTCPCASALSGAVMTSPEACPSAAQEILDVLRR